MVVRDWAWPKFKLECLHYYVWALIDNALLIDLKKCADSREEREIVTILGIIWKFPIFGWFPACIYIWRANVLRFLKIYYVSTCTNIEKTSKSSAMLQGAHETRSLSWWARELVSWFTASLADGNANRQMARAGRMGRGEERGRKGVALQVDILKIMICFTWRLTSAWYNGRA